MKKEDRLVYFELMNEINCYLCSFCKYGEYESDGCCCGYYICSHPLEVISEQIMEPTIDCWGFRPDLPLSTIVDIVGAILAQGFNDGWGIRFYPNNAMTVYGRGFDRKTRTEYSGKVRIGHDGKQEELELATT